MTSITDRAVGILMAVRGGGAPAPGLGDATPATEADVWAVQREVLRRMGGSIGGWKCAYPPGKPRTAAMLDAAGLRQGPAKWKLPASGKIGIETEIAFRMGRPLPPRGTPYTRAEVMEAVAAAFPAIELVVSRYADPSAVSVAESMADGVAHAGLVVGADVPGWRDMDLGALTVRQSHAGQVQVERVGGNPSGDPYAAITNLANHLHEFGLMLEAGQVVTTGSVTGLIAVGAGRVVGAFDGFGEAVVDLA